MKDELEFELKPMFPTLEMIVICGSFLSAFFFLFLELKIEIIGLIIFFVVLGLIFLTSIEFARQTITYSRGKLDIKGYFSIRSIELKDAEILGYELYEKADQELGYYREIRIVTKKGTHIRFPKLGHPEQYDILVDFISNKYEFLYMKEDKYANLIGRWLPIIGLISGILSVIVGVLKFLI